MKGRTKNMVDEPVMPNTVKMMNMSHHQAVLHRGCCGRSAIHRSQNCCSWPLVGESALLPDDLLSMVVRAEKVLEVLNSV